MVRKVANSVRNVAQKATDYLKKNSSLSELKKSKLVPIKDKNDKSGLVPIKDRNDKSKLVSIKDRNDESELVPIANKNGTPSVSVNKGVATVHNGKNNYYTLDLNKLSFIKDKSKKPNITQVNDGIATIKDDKGNLHDVRMTLKK